VKEVQIHRILINRKPLKRNSVLTEEKLDDIGCQLENSPRKALRQLALKSGVSVALLLYLRLNHGKNSEVW
jgi:hypothetical protein